MSFRSAIAAIAAAAMLTVGREIPAIGGQRTPTFERHAAKDGLGRRKAPKAHPRHNAKRKSREWREFAAKVAATHSGREDPRDDKYLHAHARSERALRRYLARAA